MMGPDAAKVSSCFPPFDAQLADCVFLVVGFADRNKKDKEKEEHQSRLLHTLEPRFSMCVGLHVIPSLVAEDT